MQRSRKKKKSPKRVLALPDLEQAKSAVLNTLTSNREFRAWQAMSRRCGLHRHIAGNLSAPGDGF